MVEKRKIRSGRTTPMVIDLGNGGEQLLKTTIRETTASAVPSASDTFVAYAAPNFWGPRVTIATHIGSVTYKITYEPVGDTLVIGRVTYWKGPDSGHQVSEEFSDETIITTANSVANVECEFKGVPTGSTVNGTVS